MLNLDLFFFVKKILIKTTNFFFFTFIRHKINFSFSLFPFGVFIDNFKYFLLEIFMRKHRQIALLGFPGVGKSSLAHHFVYQHFSDVYDPNIKTSKILFFIDFIRFLFNGRSSTSM